MQINNTTYATATTLTYKSGTTLPPAAKQQNNQTTQESNSLRDLAKSIDPTNMSRNDARAIAEALGQTGGLKIDDAFALQSLVVVNEDGSFRTATKDDSIMNEKFNMYDALNTQIEFNKSKGLSTEHLEKALGFLEKLQALRANTEVDLYA